MRRGDQVLAGTYPYEGDGLVTSWHAHDLHQIEYAFEGTVEVETDAGHYLLPPQQAVWIPAGLEHQTTIEHRVRTVSVFFHPSLIADAGTAARVLGAAPVLREMILYATRWPITRTDRDPAADRFFLSLADVVQASIGEQSLLWLPTSRDPLVAAVMAHTARHLSTVTAADAGAAVGLSERSVRRRLRAETGMSWRTYLLQARLLRAMSELARPGASVLDVAHAVGFGSLSAFSRAFRRHAGETPSGYRRRVHARETAVPPA